MSERGRSPPRSGPGSASGGRGPSPSPSRSAASGAAPPAGWKPGLGFDPARPKDQEKGNTRMELPPDAYVSETKKDLFLLRGKNLNTEGKPAKVGLNQYRMTKFDFKKKIYQYDVSNLPSLLSNHSLTMFADCTVPRP